ncbi:MAG TPA: endonuclease/exonuclease/phosphatase family protein [Candidatus Thermoplasmatota archaeon]|nr:endonuclease/exonuclease/phosphatase family protein [Candidatus Thermoplasmatota archaeon]
MKGAHASVKVMTFNLRRDKASDGENGWEQRRHAAAEVIRRHAPDLVGTQEGLPGQVGYLESHFPEYGFLGEARFGGRNDEFNAILYRKDRFKVLGTGNFWLSDTPDVPGSRTWGNLVPRMATWARFMDKDTGNVFHHLNTHLDHLVPRARKLGALLIQKRLPQDVPVLMTGDFNALQQGGTYRYLTRAAGLTDSRWACATPVESRWNATFHHFTGRGLYRIDYVLGRHLARYSDYQVVRDRVEGKLPSDHFPVVAQVDVPAMTRSLTPSAPATRATA